MDEDQRRYLKRLAALRRVNRQIAAWDELEAMELMPNSLRPHVEVPRLDREQLKDLQEMLTESLAELLGARPAGASWAPYPTGRLSPRQIRYTVERDSP